MTWKGMPMSFRLLALALLAPFAFTGCATVMNGETQNVAIKTESAEGQAVAQAKCTLQNDKGSWKADSPGVAQVRKSAQDLMVECQKDGHAAGFGRAISRVNPSFFGNVVIGGGVGAIIDHTKGTAYDYPAELPIKMGTTTVIDKREEGGAKKNDVATADAAATGATASK